MQGATARRANLLLALGAAIGVLAALLRFVASDASAWTPETLGDGVIARVDGRPIRTDDYERALETLASDKRNTVDEADRARVLHRLIDEELLVERGIESGIVESDPSVRKAVSDAMVAWIMSDSAEDAPSEEALRAFYRQNARLLQPYLAPTRGAGRGQPAQEGDGFEAARDLVTELYRQRARDAALLSYVGWLREQADIVIAGRLAR